MPDTNQLKEAAESGSDAPLCSADRSTPPLIFRSKIRRFWRIVAKAEIAHELFTITMAKGVRFKLWFHIGPCTSPDGITVLDVVFGPVALTFAWVPNAEAIRPRQSTPNETNQ